MNWDKIINWKLLAGSHDFPGPDGGTCINEAAIIAAGFKYKKVSSANDCPPCFSPVLSSYLIGINDMLPEDERQRLMSFVMRLSGSADTPLVEQQRLELIVLRTVQKVVSSAMYAANLEKQALACAGVTNFQDAYALAAEAPWAASEAPWAASWAAAEATWAAWVTCWDADAINERKKLYDACIAIAEEAFAIGNQATPIDVACVTERLERAKVSV